MVLNFLISFSSDFGTVFIAEEVDAQELSAKALTPQVNGKVRIAVITQTHTLTYTFLKG